MLEAVVLDHLCGLMNEMNTKVDVICLPCGVKNSSRASRCKCICL